MITDANSVKSELKNMNRSYNNSKIYNSLYADVGNQQLSEIESLQKSTALDIGETTADFIDTKRNFDASNIVGNRTDYMNDVEDAMSKAYESSLQNFRAGLNSIDENSKSYVDAINKSLEENAKNTSDYFNAHLDYLDYLANQSDENDETIGDRNALLTNEYFKGLLDPNNPTYNRQYAESLMFDTQGNLTEFGKQVFSNIEGMSPTEAKGFSFDDYLSSKNKNLYEWIYSTNPYSVMRDEYGNNTNSAAFRQIYGLGGRKELKDVTSMFDNMNAKQAVLNIDITDDESLKQAKDLLNTFTINDKDTKDQYTRLSKAIEEYENINIDFKNNDKVWIDDRTVFRKDIENIYKDELDNIARDLSTGKYAKVAYDRENFVRNTDEYLDKLNMYATEYAKQLAMDNVNSEWKNLAYSIPNISYNNSRNEYLNKINTTSIGSEYTLSNGDMVDFLDVTTKGVNKGDGNNFSVEFKGQTYKLEIDGNKTLNADVVSEIKRMHKAQTGKDLDTNSVVTYKGRVYVYVKGNMYPTRNRYSSDNTDTSNNRLMDNINYERSRR